MSDKTEQPWHVGHNGATLFTRHEAQRFARSLIESQDYKDSLTRRMKADALPAGVECMLWYFAYGKPVEQVNLNVSEKEDLSALGVNELLKRAREISERLQEAQDLENAIPAEYSKAS